MRAALLLLAACGRVGFDEAWPCVADFSASGNSACVVRGDGMLACWGRNVVGELGDGSTIDRATAVRVPLAGVVAVGAGERSTCAVLTDGTAWCWGANEFG